MHKNRARREELDKRIHSDRKGGVKLKHVGSDKLGYVMAKAFVNVFGLKEKGRQNALSHEISVITIRYNNLPESFDGFRILHISDLHIDGDEALHSAISSAVEGLDFDAVFITGDYRFVIIGESPKAYEYLDLLTGKLLEKAPVYGVLGNHDVFECAMKLEEMGVRMLINENTRIRTGNSSIVLAGVDADLHYDAADLPAAMQGVGREEFTILLSHTPTLYAEAQKAGADLYLCGHTHGGQFCLPSGKPIVTYSKVPRPMRAGLWSFGAMQGYTNVGAGSSAVFARLNNRPEVALITLKQDPGNII